MTNRASDLKRGDCTAPTDPALLGNPLDFFHEDHLRERQICATLDRIAYGDPPDPEDAASVRTFLEDELPLHLEDEELDLFPLVRRRCEPDAEIDRAIGRLSADHRHAEAETPKVMAVLGAIEAGAHTMTEEERTALIGFAAHARRHLIFENAIILPFARLRLTPDDLETLRLRMLQRRGLDRLMEFPDAD